MIHRPRRNRKSAAVRGLVQETAVSVSDLIFPLFLTEGKNTSTEIKSMPGIYRFTVDNLLKEIDMAEVKKPLVETMCKTSEPR